MSLLFVRGVVMAALVVASVCASSPMPCVRDGNGLCIAQCPPGTITYVSGCGSKLTISQRTCKSPIARPMGYICDMIRCDCKIPRVWDENVEKCVMLKDCSTMS